jgi:hypothetical protein
LVGSVAVPGFRIARTVSTARVKFRAPPTEPEMPFYLVWLEGEDGRRHLFDTDPIEAESQEDALKIVMGLSLAAP